ncbi:CHAD domain-containing protein [Paenarthrobacter sp. S56]|uniref:CHAD domain-containing protein n=1 Tax=Paenarthrobacter sp. S56 TaxID=3138179 RepID=UPI00321A159E
MASEVRDSLQLYIAFQLTELEGCLPLVSAADQEAVHNARLALRRIRSVASLFESCLPPIPPGTRDDIRWLARSLGRARDEYVLARRMNVWLDAAADWLSPDALRRQVAAVFASSGRLSTSVGNSPRAKSTIDSTARAFFPERAPGQKLPKPSVPEAVMLLQAGWGTVQENLALALAADPGMPRHELLHRARKDIKALRFSLEAITGPVGPASATVLGPAAALQRVLGEHHDSVAALVWVASLSGRPGIADEDVAKLTALENRRLSEAEAALREAVRLSPIPRPVALLEAQEASGTLAAEEAPGQSYLAM